MPRNKVLEKAKVSLPSGRNAFDLSQERAQVALAGELNICYAQPFVAGTKGKINRMNFTRTADVVSPAFHRVTEHYDFFIVPIHSLWSQWENWKLNINDLKNTAVVPWSSGGNVPDLSLPVNAPRMDFNNLGDRLGYKHSGISENECRRFNDAIRICSSLRFGSTCVTRNVSAQVMSLFLPTAYQKCYFEHYRNTAYENNNPYAYNLDWLYDGTHNGLLNPNSSGDNVSNLQDDFVAREIFKIRRVNYRNDYFHNIYPALNYVSSSPQGLDFALPSNIGQLIVTGAMGGSGSNAPNVYSGTVVTGANANHSLTGSAYTVGSSVQAIRAAFALDKLMRASAYAPKHVKEQFKAQYGVDGVEDYDMVSERIGSFESTVQFQEVTNMAQSMVADLGDLGAKGLGGSSTEKDIDFYCKYDSIVIGLHYFLPRARYDAIGIHPWNTKIVRESFYIKAFENLGLRPFYSYNISQGSVVVGWTVPNFEYKILPDLNFGPFMQKFDEVWYDAGSAGSPPPSVDVKTDWTNVLSTFVPHSQDVINRFNPVTAEYFKVAPEDLDNIFVVAVPADHRLSVYQFFTDMRIICKTVQPMSVHGQPSI